MFVMFTFLSWFFLSTLLSEMAGAVLNNDDLFKVKFEINKVSDFSEDDALFLTPYIEREQIKEAQELSVVTPMLKGVESFAGYLTVNKSCSSNMFFWLFKSQLKNWEERPLVLWLQGGPGTSSLFGLFTELGPFWVNKKQKLKKRKYSWNRKYNLVFIDNPVGTGFSFTKSDFGFANNEVDVARDLYEALVQIYTLFPALQKNKLFITGESYAGKFVPAIGYKIYQANKVSTFKLPLAGLMIGSGFTDPISHHDYSAYLYQTGLIDRNKKEDFERIEDDIRTNIRASKFLEAQKADDVEFYAVKNLTGLRNIFDFVRDDIRGHGPEESFLSEPKNRRAIHVGPFNLNNNKTKVYDHLKADIQKSVKPWIEELLTAEEFPILYFSGQLDVLLAYPLMDRFYRSLQWPYAKDYHDAKRCQFKVGSDVAGYYKSAGSFTEVLVRNTGHMVPIAQPKWVYELLDRFITNITSFECH